MSRSDLDTHDMTLAGLDLIKQAMSIYDRDLRLVLANLQMQKMFNLPADLVRPGARFEDTIRHLAERGDYGDIADIESFIAERSAQARTFEPHYFERTRANGTTISIEGSPLRQGGWVAVYTDITEVKAQEALLRNRSENLSDALLQRSEELSQTNRALQASITALEQSKHALTVSEDRLNLTNSMIPAHIARVDVSGVYTYSNQKLPTVLPDRASDIIGMHMRDALGADVFAIVAPSFDLARAGHPQVLEFEDAPSAKHIRLAMTPEQNAEGNVSGVYLLSMDVTEETTARAALTHSRRRELAAQLTSGMAHDFSNLLTIILGQQSRLDALDDASDEVAEISATIKQAALRGGVLLDGIAQIDAQRTLEPRAVEMSAFARDLEQLASAAVPEGVSLNVHQDTKDTHLRFDPGFAQDALLNLVLNAVEALAGPGEISVLLRRDGALLEMTVTDTGPGFSDHALKNALTPFYTSKAGQMGRGLGLSTAFDFAKESGGAIRLANVANSGAQVRIRIPYEPARQITPGLILLVEDTEDIRVLVRGYLRKMGHSVIEARDATEAASLMEVPGLTHVLTDLVLDAGTTGLDVAMAARGAVPVTIITGLPPDDPLRQMAAKDHAVLSKPFDYETLEFALQGSAS